jgi:protocatechuate 3,4-dioxygenase, alpha subunit
MLTTPSQTVGPFFAYGLTARQYGYNYSSVHSHTLVDDSISGERINIIGQVFDGQGLVINDAMIELIQDFEVNGQKITKMSRQGTGPDPENKFRFTTVKPVQGGEEAPHIRVILMMRGSLQHLHTHLYFSDENEANNQDLLLNSINQERRNTLIANKFIKNNQVYYTFDIHMQGPLETVFLGL